MGGTLLNELTADEKLACECLFGLMWRAASEADGRLAPEEQSIFNALLNATAGNPGEMLPRRLHTEMHSEPDLAQELLVSDKGALQRHLAAAGSFQPALDVEINLESFVQRGGSDRSTRIRNARGVFYEALYFAIKTARGNKRRFVDDEEARAITVIASNFTTVFSQTSIVLPPDDVLTVLNLLYA